MLTLEVKKSDREIFDELIKNENSISIVEPSYLDGEQIIQALVEITKVTAPLVASIILTHINSNKLEIKKNGINITMPFRKRNLDKIELIKELMDRFSEENADDESVD